MTETLTNIDGLWNYNDPHASEMRFREHLESVSVEEHPALYAELLTQIARAQGLKMTFDAAHATLDEAEALLTVTPSRERVRFLLERGRVYNSAGDTEKAKALFIDAWEMAQAIYEDFYAVDAAHMIGITEGANAALHWNLKAVAYAEASQQDRARTWLGSLYNNIGWTYHDMGNYDEALRVFETALAYREAEGIDENIRIARWCIGRVLRSLGKYEAALALQRELLKEIEAVGENPGYAHEEIAECLQALGQHADAKPHFAKAYAALNNDPWLMNNESERLKHLKESGEG